MKLVSTNCPNCGGIIDIDPDNIVRFCKNCGTKVMLDIDSVQKLLIEKERTKQESIKSAERKRIAELNMLTKSNEQKTLIIAFMCLVGMMFLSAIVIIVIALVNKFA